jgi:rhodanese-related sulfurtransferase
MISPVLAFSLLFVSVPSPLAAAPAVAVAQDLASVPRIAIDELKTLMARKQVVLVDVRDPMAFGQGHIPGAVNVPFDFLPEYVEKWKQDKRLVVTYCACLNEGTAANAALDMNAFGLKNVKALLGGYNEWVKRGERVEK